MATIYDRIFADVRKDIPSVVDATVRQELFRVMTDFTQFTNIWQEDIPFTLPQGFSGVVIAPAGNVGKINRLLVVFDPAVTTMPRRWVMAGITMRVPGQLQFPRVLPSAVSYTAKVAKYTADPVDVDDYPSIDPWIVEKYADVIRAGVMSRLQMEPQKPYSNPLLAKLNYQDYINGRGLARANDANTNVFDGQGWRYPQGFSTVAKRGGWV